jgi:hypothetical protein
MWAKVNTYMPCVVMQPEWPLLARIGSRNLSRPTSARVDCPPGRMSGFECRFERGNDRIGFNRVGFVVSALCPFCRQLRKCPLAVDGLALDVIQAPKQEPRIINPAMLNSCHSYPAFRYGEIGSLFVNGMHKLADISGYKVSKRYVDMFCFPIVCSINCDAVSWSS